MIAETMLYLAAISVAASLAGLLADAGLRRLRLPIRWIWLGALALGPALLLGAGLWRWVGASAPVPVAALPIVLDLDAIAPVAGEQSAAWRARLDLILGAAWAAGSAALVLLLARGFAQLARERAGWRARRLRGAVVFLSDRRGPAVCGLLRTWMVLPRWVLGLPREAFRMVLRHEAEHLRAGDSRVVLGGLALAGLTPWNPIAWWQLRRLRTAVEIDCDRRVLDRVRSIERYGAALLSVAGAIEPQRELAFAAFSENARTLKTRILVMTAIRSRWTRAAGAALFLGAAAVAVQACGVESPLTPSTPVVGERDARAQTMREATDEPAFTPFTSPPQLTNRDEVRGVLEARFAALEPAGLQGRTQIWLRISDAGVVERVTVHRTSGHEAVDRAAVEVGRAMRFTPAQNDGVNVHVWVSVPVMFQKEEPAPRDVPAMRAVPAPPAPPAAPAAEAAPEPAAERDARAEAQVRAVEQQWGPEAAQLARARLEGAAPPPAREITETPSFTPFTAAPQLTNREAVGAALEASYPKALRDVGVTGQVEIWIRISAEGSVDRVAVHKSSGHAALDEGALAVGRVMQFRPARDGDVPVPVWVSIPITFRPR